MLSLNLSFLYFVKQNRERLSLSFQLVKTEDLKIICPKPNKKKKYLLDGFLLHSI